MIAHRHLAKLAYASFPGIRWRYPPYQNAIYLTFDDGPFPPLTESLLNFLKEKGVPATFFLSGKNLYQYRHQLHTLDYTGHAIGNHSFHHIPHFGINKRMLAREIDMTDRIILDQFGRLARIFRPPYGIFDRSLFSVLKSTGKTMMLWTVMAYDFKWSAAAILKHLYANVHAGDIVVFHDSPTTENVLMDVIPPFVEYCHRRGWKFNHADLLKIS